jgi:uncharacterized protein
MQVFLDANVLFSASLRERDREYAFFDVARRGRCRLLTSGYVLEEARRNLEKKAPHALGRFGSLVPLVEVVLEPAEALVLWAQDQGLPAKDAPVLAAAVAAKADILTTGDRRHFAPLFGRTLENVRILDLAEGLATVLEAAEQESS